jgi:hypothetical protein
VQLDWPARVAMLVGACPGTGCKSTEALVSCAPDPCAPASGAGCSATLVVDGLDAGTVYEVRFAAEDDEGHLIQSDPRQVVTAGALPRLLLAEVMASPPGPTPRSDGEYVEIVNAGPSPADVSVLALAGADGVPRPVMAQAGDALLLAPGGRALAVGASFDATRYVLGPEVPVLRAATQRLLGRGLADDAPPPLSLLAPDPDGGVIEIDRFPGGGPHCPQGDSLESSPGGGWICGADGGSPGRSP